MDRNDWRLHAIRYENRENQDPHPSEIQRINETITHRAVTTYNYTYDVVTKRHILRFNGLLKYSIPRMDSRATKLFQLLDKYPNSPIPTPELEDALIIYFSSLTLPWSCADDDLTNTALRYNIQLSMYLASTLYASALGILILENKELLNYDDLPMYQTLLKVTKHPILIPTLSQNYFDLTPRSYTLYIDAPTSESVKTYIDTTYPGLYAAAHIDYTWDCFHIALFESEQDFNSYVAAKILEDWRLHAQLETGGIRVTQRVVERVLLIRSNEVTRRMNAIGGLYPSESKTITSRDTVFDLLLLSDLYYSHTDGIKRENYLRLYNDVAIFAVTQKQFDYLQGNARLLSFTRYYIIDPLIAEPMIINMSEGVVTQLIPLVGDDVKLKANQLQAVNMVTPSSLEVVELQTATPTWSELHSHVIYKPGRELWTDQHRLDALATSELLFLVGTSERLGSLNNLHSSRVIDQIDALRRATLRSFIDLSAVITIGSREHLDLLMCTRSTPIQSSSGRLVAQNDSMDLVELNNSSPKMNSIYHVLADRAFSQVDGLYVPNGAKLLILGAIKEPYVDILRRFNTGRNVTIQGLGREAVFPNSRLTIGSTIEKNFNATYYISDVDQTDARTPDDVIDQLMAIIDLGVLSAKGSIIKVNYPTEYIITTFQLRLLGLVDPNDNHLEFELLRFASQNAMTYEAFVWIKVRPIGINDQFGHFNNEDIVIRRCETAIAAFIRDEEDIDNVVVLAEPPVITPQIFAHVLQFGDYTYNSRLYLFRDVIDNHIINMSALQQIASTVIHYRHTTTSTFVNYIAYSDRLRMAIQRRNNSLNAFTSGDQFVRAIPYGLGLDARHKKASIFRNTPATLVHKYMIYRMIFNATINRNYTSVRSIGGRNGEDYLAVRNAGIPYTIIDPSAQIDPILTLNYNWHVEKRVYAFDEVIPPQTLVLCLFVIMNEPDGIPTSVENQINRITQLANAISISNGSSVWLSFYNLDLCPIVSTRTQGIITIGENQVEVPPYGFVNAISVRQVFDVVLRAGAACRLLYWRMSDYVDTLADNLFWLRARDAIAVDALLSIVSVVEISYPA